MTRIFVDANVIVSVLNKEYPVFTHSSRILSLSTHSKYEIYTSPICLAIAFYFAEKKHGTVNAKNRIAELCKHIKIAANSINGIKETLANKKINDFEDGLQYYAALEKKCHYIVTEDLNDFHFSTIETFTSEGFFDQLLNKN